MELIYLSLALSVIGFLAHIVKGVTGFGPAIIFVSIGSLLHDPVEIIVLASLLDIIGGIYLIIINPRFLDNKRYWLPVGTLMIIGAIVGSLTLFVIPSSAFEYVLGFSIIIISLWFLLGKSEPEGGSEDADEVKLKDGSVGCFSGFCGGFTGMGGPPLIAYLGSKFEKDLFRAVIVPIFLMAALARFFTYGFLGMVTFPTLSMYILPSIGVILGNYLGNILFDSVDQKWFTILVGIILLLSGVRLLVL